ncbi:hypothetical protein [Colwellia sp. BRX8-9]|jgi:hypothetical protein|uniref:hypothetical protein n=1 Tax=Colwellia sp. BRX8-9 TaxID=2759831 RepID=UPI0015F72DD0|nr:hypothetical protein [Colwellia sp. BRX8-9]MBA6348814.1 hypothetical protein [Colwellia sp. BRX8-9]
MSKADDDNHSNQMNPNNDAYHSSRGNDDDGYDDDGYGVRSKSTLSNLECYRSVSEGLKMPTLDVMVESLVPDKVLESSKKKILENMTTEKISQYFIAYLLHNFENISINVIAETKVLEIENCNFDVAQHEAIRTKSKHWFYEKKWMIPDNYKGYTIQFIN